MLFLTSCVEHGRCSTVGVPVLIHDGQVASDCCFLHLFLMPSSGYVPAVSSIFGVSVVYFHPPLQMLFLSVTECFLR